MPDVCGVIGAEEDPYSTHAVAVAIEVLSPDDRFMRVIQKCRKYAEWGVQDILVYDPIGREAWYWDTVTGHLIRAKEIYRFHSQPVNSCRRKSSGAWMRNFSRLSLTVPTPARPVHHSL